MEKFEDMNEWEQLMQKDPEDFYVTMLHNYPWLYIAMTTH